MADPIPTATTAAGAVTTEAGKAVGGTALKSVGAQALGAGLLSGGIAAAIPFALRGFAELTPQSREERRLNRKYLREAEEGLDRGKKFGFGPGAKRRQIMVAQRMQDYRAQTAGTRDTMQRQQSMLGLGRSGVLADQRAALAKQDADYLGRVRAGVEDEARAIGLSREAMLRNQLNQARGIQAGKAAEQRDFFTKVGTQAVGVGIQAGTATKEGLEADTRNENELEAALARLGISPTSVEGVNGRRIDTRDATA